MIEKGNKICKERDSELDVRLFTKKECCTDVENLRDFPVVIGACSKR